MPDTFTHIALPALFSRLYRYPILAPLVLIGTVLPDYLREIFKFLLPAVFKSAVYPFHSILGIICVSLFITSFFTVSLRGRVFISLLTGQSLHLIFDLFQFYLNGGQLYLLLPCWETYQIGIYSDTYWIYLFIISFISFSVYCLLHFKNIYQSNT
jgi:hypothetical protein